MKGGRESEGEGKGKKTCEGCTVLEKPECHGRVKRK